MEPTTYETPGELTLELRIPSGDVTVRTADTDRTTLRITGERAEDDVTVRFDPGLDGHHQLVVQQRRNGRGAWRLRGLTVEVTAPTRTRLRVEGGSTDLVVRGPLTSAVFLSGSGDASLEDVREGADVKVASGDLRAGSVGGLLTFHSASGDLRADAALGGVVARTASGDVQVGDARGELRISTISGDVSLGGVGGGSVDVQAVSGDVTVGVLPGTGVYLDLSSLSGSTSSDLPVSSTPGAEAGPQLSVRANTVSGDIRIRRGSARSTAA